VAGEALAGLNLSATTHTDAGTYNADAWTFTDVTGNYNDAAGTVDNAIAKAPSVTTVTINGGPFTYTGAAVTPATVSVTGAGGLNLTPDPTYANNVNAGTATASYSYAGDANHEPSSDSETFVITPMVVTVGGSFTVAEKVYDGTATAAIEVYELTLVTPVAGDDVALSPVAVFDSADVGAGKVATLTAATTLTGADAGNYTLSLDGAPTATGTVLIPAVSGTQSLDGFRSPSSGTIIGSSFSVPAGASLAELSWQPTLPAGWSLVAAAGDGNPAVNGSQIVFAGPFEEPTISFTYTVSIPGNEMVTNYLNAAATFRLESMINALTVERLPATLLLKRYHSADYRAPFWVIDTSESTRFLNYSRIGGYAVEDNLQDGFVGTAMPDAANLTDGRHSGDFRLPFWTIDTSEKIRLQSLWRAGA
jgi:hypothetical protein